MLYARDYRQSAWKKLNGQWGNAILSSILYSLVASVPFLDGIMLCGYSKFMLDLSRGKNPSIDTVFKGFDNALSALLLGLLNGIFLFLWSLLLFIPGIIMTYAYSMSFYLMADDPSLTATQARKKSIELMRGNKWRLFCLGMSFFGWALLTMITFGLAAIFVAPYQQLATAEFYRSLINDKDGQASADVFNASPRTCTAAVKNDVFCSECGAANSSDYIFCVECGSRLNAKRKEEQSETIAASATECPACGASVKGGSVFCTECGYKLTQQTAAPAEKHKFCTKCGERNVEDATFCRNCGNKIG